MNLKLTPLEETTSTVRKIKFPTFFSLEKEGKISFLLGTNHLTPLDELPEECLKIIRSCASFVTEESESDADEFYTKAILREQNSTPWENDLPKDVVASLELAIEKFF